MSVIYKFLFPSKPDGTAMSLLILALRIPCLVFYSCRTVYRNGPTTMSCPAVFPDPLGIGSQLSLVLAILVKWFVRWLSFFGFLYRLTMIPMIFTMYRILCCSWF